MGFGLAICLLSFFSPYPIFLMKEGLTKEIISSLFISIERQMFTIGITLFLTPCVLGKASIFREMLGNRALIPLARLNNSALIVHGTILMWYFFGKYQILRIDLGIINMSFIALTLLSYIYAIVFSLILETPLISLETLLWCPKKKRIYNFKTEHLSESIEAESIQIQNKEEAGDKSENNTKDSCNEVPLYAFKEEDLKEKLKLKKPEMMKRRLNSLGEEKELKNKKNIVKTLLNDSEDSKNLTGYNEPLLDQNN